MGKRGRGAVWRALVGVGGALGGVAFAHAAAAHVGAPDWHQRLYNPHMLDQPRIVSRPASGDTYYPGETITVYVPWGRTQTRTSISVNSVGTVQLVLTVGGAQRTLTGIWEDRSARYGPAFTIRRLYFDYVVQAGDRDTDGVSLAENALSSPGSAESGIRGTAGTSFRQFELEKLLHGFGAQSGHKVDTRAPSFAGVSSPSLLLYTCGPFDDCGSVRHRLPTLANAAQAHNVTYSVTSALPSGLSLDSSTAEIVGSHNGSLARRNYTLRATDGFSRTADLAFSLEVRDGAGVESIAVTSNPGSDKTYGKNGDFGTNDTITVRVDFNRPIGTIIRSNVCLNIRIGRNTRRACNPTGASRQDKLHFSYAVVEGDWDGDGISFPANPLGAGKDGNLRFYRAGIGGGDNRIDRSFGAVLDDPNHKVRGRQTTPSFGSTASPSFSWVKDNAVSQALPAATGGDGGLTYSVKEGLPDGLVFAAATRTLSGTPTAVQGRTNYTLVATDGDGDKTELRFSIEVREIVLSISSPSVSEGAAGETAALPFAVTLNRAPGRQVTVDWAAAADPGTAASGVDYTAFSGGALTFAAADTSKTVEVTVTGDALDEPDETIRIALSNPSGAVVGSAATGVGTIADDDPTPTLTLALSDPDAGRPDTIRESGAGNATTVTASLAGGTSGETLTVTVSAASTYAALAADGGFALSAARTLTIAAGQAASAGAVTIAATDDAIDSADKTARVSGAVAGGHGLVAAPADLTLTIADEDSRPSSALALAPASISESGGVATVTATLSHPSAEAVTIAVSATASTGAVDGDFALSTANTLTVAAGRTASAGVVTVTAVGNGTDSPDKQVTVKGSASGGLGLGAADPADATLTLRDDDGAPTVSLVLSSSSIAENGGVATVSAALGGASSEAVTVTVAASAVAASGAVAGDFALSGGTTLTIAANATTSTGTVTITAADNDVDAPDKRVTVSGTAAGGNGVADPASATLTLADDEALPTATLALAPASITEAGGLATVTATLSGESSAATTLTVTAAAGAHAAAGDFTLSAAATLTIAAGETASAGTVTVAAIADTTDSPDKLVAVGATAAGGNGIADPAAATLTVTDDDALPTLTLTLSPSTIDESGAGSTATVTAALSHPSSEAVTVTVSAVAVSPADSGDFSVSAANTLTIAAGETVSVGAVTVAAVDDRADAPDKRVTVKGAASGGRGAANPPGAALTIADDEALPTVALALSSTSISETGGISTVTATLSGPSSASVTVTVAAAAGTGAVAGDFTLSAATTLTIAAGATTSAGLVTVTANGNTVDSPNKSVTVSGTAAGGNNMANPPNVTLTLEDDDALPTVALALSDTSISETGGVSTVTATLSGPSSAAVTVTVAAAAGAGAVAADFTLSTATTLTFAANATTSAGLVTMTANGNAVDSPNKSVTVSGTAAGGNGVANPPNVTLTLVDDDALPTVVLVLSASSIMEAGGISTVTARLSGASSEAVTVTVGAAAGAGAVAADFTLSAAKTLTIAAGTTESAGLVTVTANGNVVDSPDKSVTVSGAAAGGNGVANPPDVTLTLADDDATATAALVLTPSSILENGEVSTVTARLSHPTTAATTLTVAAAAGANAAAADFTLSTATTLTIAAGSTTSAGLVTVTANDNALASGMKSVTVSATAVGGRGVAAPSAATLTIRDDEYGLDVGSVSGQATEAGGQATFTVELQTQPSAAVTVAVSSRDADEGTVSPPSLTFTRGNWSTAQTVTATGVQDTIDDGTVTWQVRLDPSSGDGDYDGLDNVDVDVTTTDDDDAPGVTLALAPASVSESGGVATVTARLSHASGAATTVTVTAVSGFFTVGTDATITIAAGATTAASDTVLVTAVDNTTDAPDRTGTVTATVANARAAADSTTMSVTGAALTVRDDDAAPGVTLALAPASVSENGGIATVTATLSNPSSEPSTVTVAAVSGSYTVGTDATITIAAGATTAASDTVLVTAVDDAVHQGAAGRSVTVTAALANGQGAGAVTGAALTLTDDETRPTAVLVLDPASITETGGVSTVTATLSGPSSEAVTVTVGAVAGTGAVAADFDLSSATTLTIAAGATTSAGVVTVTANGNAVDSPDKSVTVSGTAAGGNGVVNPPNVTLTLEDDDALPTVALALSSTSISETGGVSTVTATLSGPSSAAVTVTVAAAAGAGAVAADFTLSTAATLTFAAGATTSAGVVTVTANGNTVDSPNKSVTVSGTAAGGNGVANPPNVTLTLEDDDALPTVALALSASSISETGGVSTVTATLSGPSSVAVTVTVAAAAGAGAVAADFTLSTAATLTFAANATTSTGLVTVTANGNDVDSPNKSVTVSGAAAGGNGVTAPPNVTLTLTDDDALPTVSLALSSTSITETGGVSTVTARLSGPSSAAVTVTVAAAAGAGAVADDFTLSAATTLTIAAGATTSAGTVTVTANGNAVDSPNKSVTVSGAAAGGNGVSNPPNVTLTLTDDDALPTVSLALAPSSIAETNGVATVTARLSGASSAAVTVTVAAAAGTGAVAADFTLSGATTLTIAAGSTESAGLVTVTANGNDVDSPNKSVTVSGAAAGGNGVANPSNATLTLADDDALPTLALVLTPATVGENGGVSTVTATLSGKSSAAVTLTVSAAAVASTGAVAGDFALSSATTLTIAAGATVSAGAVTVTANDNAADEPDVEVRVTATAAGGNGAANPPAVTLTIRDDEGPPTVTLVLTPSTIDESGTGSTAAVTATLNRASSAVTTVTVSVAPVASTGAAAGDYALSSAATLTIASGATTSSGTVTVAAVDNDTDAPNKRATVSGAAVNDQSVQQPVARTLTIADDDAAPDATLALSSTSISENGGVTTVTATLSRRSAQATTVTVQGAAGVYSVGSGAASRIVIAAGATSSADGAALTAVDNDVDAADRQVTVTAVLTNGHGVGTVSGGGVALTLTDDDTAGLAVSPATSTGSRLETTESGGTATFTVKLATEPTGDVEIGVASSDTGEGTVGPSTLTFTTTSWSTAQTVTLTGVDDAAADGNRGYTVTLTIDQTNTVDSNYDALSAVTVYARNRDNEFGLAVSAVSGQATEAAGGQATFTVALRTQPTAAVTVAVASRDASEGSVSPPSLTFTGGATGNWGTAQTVTVTGVQDTTDDGTVTWAVRLDPASGDGNYDTSSVEEDVSVTTTDDDGPPSVTLTLNPSSIAESGTGNVATVSARLSHASGAATTVTVTGVSGFYAAGTDAAIVIPAGSTQAASDTATVVAVDNTRDEPDRTATVTATVTNARAAADSTTMSVTGAALTVRDDDAAPGAALALDPASVSENGGISTVTATLSRPSSQPSTVTVTAVSGAYTLGTDATIVIAAGSTTAASDTVLITAVDDSIHQGTAGRSATVSGRLANGHGAGAVTGASLALTDDESLPVVALVLDPASISEEGGLSTVTATLSGPSSAAATVTVAAAAGTGAVAADFDLSTATALTIAAGATTSAGVVTVTANGNAVASGSKSVTVSGASAGGNGVANPPAATLTITDDDAPQTTLVLSSNSIAENGGVATVTATLDRQSAVAVTVTVAATAVSPAVAGDFTLSAAATLTFAANATTSTGLVTVTAVNDTTDAPNKAVTVSGTASDSLGLTNHPPSVTLAITDDDAAPTATLSLNPASVTENAGVSTVSATLSHPSSQPSTVTVTAVSGSYTVGSDTTITIAAGATTAASDTVLITAVDDSIHQGTAGRSVTVSGTLANGQGAGAVTGASLALTDDESLPTVALVLDPASISEEGGISTVTATLSGPSSAAATVTVAAAAGTGAVAADFDLSTATTLTIAAGATTSAGVVTVTANGNAVASGSKSVTVSGASAGGNSVANPPAATLTITDDDAPQTTLVLSSNSIAENGGVATVTATLDRQSAVAVTVTVAAAAVSPAVAGDFTLSAAATLTFAANATTSTGLVTVTAVNNTTDAPNKRVTVSGMSSDSLGLTNTPPGVTLTLTDDDAAPTATLSLNPASVTENAGVSTVSATLSHPSSQPSTVTVAGASGSYTVGTDATITIAAGATTAASDTVLVTAVDDPIHQGTAGRSTTVTAALANGQGAGAVTGASLALTDDETLPTAALVLGPSSILENGGVSTVTATLSGPSSQPTTLTVGTAAVSSTGAVAGDFTQTGTTLTIAAGSTVSAGLVTVTGNDNRVDADNKQVTVSATAAGGNGVANPANATLTLTDDDATATATLVLMPSSISEDRGISTVTARLSHPTTAAVTLTVATTAVSPAVAGDFTRTGNTLTIAAGSTTSAGLVTVAAVDNSAAQGNKRVRVSATASGGRGVSDPSVATLTIRDDEFGLDLGPVTGQATEAGGTATFTVALLTQPSASVTVSVSSRDAGEGTVSPSSLVFTTGNWNAARTVTVRGVDDSIDDGDVEWQVRLDPASGDTDYDGIDEDVDVTTTDDDALPTLSLVLSPSSIGENGGVSTVTAALSHGSGAAVTVTVTTAAGENAVAGDFTQTGTTLTIAAAATSSAGVVTVTANDNAVVSPDKRVTVSGSVTGGYATPAAPAAATLTIENDDEGRLALTPGVVTAAAGGAAATYRVALNREPAGDVTVTVTSDNDDVTVAPSPLVFTAGDWSTAQTVTVTASAALAGGFADTAALGHEASGGGFGGVEASLPVAVSGSGTRILLSEGAERGAYSIGGRTVMVAARLRVSGGDLPSAEGSGFVVDASAVDFTPTGNPVLTLCARVPGTLLTAARRSPGRDVLLLRHDGSDDGRWSEVAGSQYDGEATPPVVCATTSEYSLFAAGYRDGRPAFERTALGTLTWIVDEERSETLPASSGGDAPIRYVVAPALPEGLTFDAATRVLSGTVTRKFSGAYTLTATDADGDTAEATFTLVVRANLEDARARLTAVNESVLPELSRAMWGSALDAVTGRLGGGVPGARGSSGLADGLAAVDALLRANAEELKDGRASLRELVSGRRVALRLGASGSGESGAGAPGADAVLWAAGDWRKLSRKQAGLDWSGDLFSAHVGADAALGPRLRGGIAASRFASAVTYTDRSALAVSSAGAEVAGKHRTRMTTATPYVGVAGESTQLWAALGVGGGRVEIEDTEVAKRFGRQSSGARFTAAAVGGSARLSAGGALELRVKASGEASRFTVKGNGEEGAIAPLAASAQRLRLAAEGSRTWALAGGAELTPALEVGGRWDGGGGATGAGLEIGGGVSWSNPGAGLTMEARARALVAQAGGMREWGASGSLRYAPGPDGRGLSLALSPSWGRAENGMERLWDEGMAARTPSIDSGATGAGLEAELGYGFRMQDGAGVLTPHAGFGYEARGRRRYLLGTRFEFGPGLSLNIEAERRDSPADRPDNGLRIDLRARW